MSSGETSGTTGPVFFEGFAWALPEAFAPALCNHRFEQGDVVHRSRAAYQSLAGDLPGDLTAIQVRSPSRSARAAAPEYEGDRRGASWQSVVELDLVELALGRSTALETTQGRLFMWLWKDDAGWLDATRADPPLPRTARDLFQALREGLGGPDADERIRRGVRFVFVVDLSSDASRVKAAAIADALRPLGPGISRDLTPAEVGVPEAGRFHPTLVVRVLSVEAGRIDAAQAALERALYSGSGDAGRFQLARHGVLECIEDGVASRVDA